MKTGAGTFWGLFLITAGIILVLKAVFHVDIPFLKILVAFMFIYLGIKILFSSFGKMQTRPREKDVFLEETRFQFKEDGPREHNVMFGKAVFDFREMKGPLPAKIKINVIFGSAIILLNSQTPVKVIIDAAFAGAQLPGGTSTFLGTARYKSDSYNKESPSFDIKGDVVFGNIDVRTT
jgi:predicted membrane protein